MLSIEDGLIDPTVQFISHLGYVDLAWMSGDAQLAMKHARHVDELAERHGTPYLRVFSYACMAMARGLAGDSESAIASLQEGIDFMHAAGAALDYEPDMMACLAECLARAGRYEEARSAAERTIGLSRDRTARLPACRALIVAGNALLKQAGSSRRGEAERCFSEAQTLIRQTGARILAPHLTAALGMAGINPQVEREA
jgi:adenylate cyclase